MLPQEAPEWVNREIATFVEALAESVPASRALVAHRPPFLRRLFDRLWHLALRRQAEDIKRN